MNIAKRFSALSFIFTLLVSVASAAIPTGYYDKCEGKKGKALLTALYETISSHTTISYDGLWTLYRTSDIDENGKIWDMYSTKRWNTGEKCGNYKNVGDCYNREHSFPKSWFNDASPMVSDAFHIYPTDGKVNGQRSNFPFGECANGTTLAGSGSVKALGRLGSSTFSGYTGKVFEPDDQYKGDFARSYFYMAACYNDRIAGWSSDMLAGNDYPAFKTWAINLLMKWTRQDEVSQKEIDRNEVVYGRQKNRNPFIDHPELAEHIWGDKQNVAWYSTGSVTTPEITHPVLNSVVNLGYAAVNVTRSVQVLVKGKNLTDNVTLSTTGAGFSVTPATLTAAQGNAGYNVTVSYIGTTSGDGEGTLTVTSGTAEREVDLTVQVEDGLPLYDATNISSDEFTVRWVYLNDESTYTLHVLQGSQEINGYPKTVTASAETYTVTGLDPETPYTYYLTSSRLTSVTKSVTTAELLPSVSILFDGDLTFSALVGTASDIAELLVEIDNIPGNVTFTVKAPFQVSTDKTNWGTSVTLQPEEDRFYLRMLGNDPGAYTTAITVTADGYTNDDVEATGTIETPQETPDFIETFNIDKNTATTTYSAYKTNVTFQGIAARWTLSDAGFGSDSRDYIDAEKTLSIRFGRSSTSSLTMAEDKTNGLGKVSFEAKVWPNDGDATIALEYSTDGGTTWQSAGDATVSSDLATHTFTINKTGNGRIRLRQTAGKRLMVDNVAITDYKGVTAVKDLEYHSWDAYCLAGELVIESPEVANAFKVYNMEGITAIDEAFTGTRSFSLPKGLYIVVAGDFSRRVLVK